MRSLTLAVLLVTLVTTSVSAAEGRSEETIRILVPRSDSAARLQGPATEWRRIEIKGNPRDPQELDRALQIAGPDAVLERVFRLSGPQDEPLFPTQWGLENTGQTGGLADADVDAPEAWSESLGSNVLIAIIDSGIDETHSDLLGQVRTGGIDTVDNDLDPSPEGSGADNAHGTMVAGILVASVNGSGLTGIAPDAKVMNLRACSDNTCWELDLADAIYFAVDTGADIINLSLGAPGNSSPELPLESAISYARSHGVLVVAAMGNDGLNTDQLPQGEIMIPGDLPYDNILSVGASDNRDQRASFSNFGPSSVDVFAPGVALPTTGALDLNAYLSVSGTSYSTPLVSGIAALLLSHDPSITYHEAIARIVGFADRPSALAGLSAYGRVNAGTTLARRFIDTSDSVFVNAIDWLAGMSITEGCNPPQNHKYCPSDSVTRGEMAVFYARSFGLPLTSLDFFSDDDGRFYEGAVNRLAAAGITVGCAPDRYCGERATTREEMAAMVSRALSLPETATDYFIDDTGSIFEGAINRIAEAGITQGCNPPTNDRFCPLDEVSRGEMAAFLKRAVGQLVS